MLKYTTIISPSNSPSPYLLGSWWFLVPVPFWVVVVLIADFVPSDPLHSVRATHGHHTLNDNHVVEWDLDVLPNLIRMSTPSSCKCLKKKCEKEVDVWKIIWWICAIYKKKSWMNMYENEFDEYMYNLWEKSW